MIAPNELRRSGVTLIEVLVSIFVASIGLLALLALFPVGALSMRQALKDSRCAQCSINGFATFKARQIGEDSALGNFGLANPYADAYTTTTQLLGTRLTAAPANGASYPIFIDPLGASVKTLNLSGSQTNNHLPVYPDTATNAYPRILRSGVSFIPAGVLGIAPFQQWFALLDDINFDPLNPGLPGSPSIPFTRDPRYTFAFMVRRPYSANPSSYDVTIVVYAGRAINTTMSSFEETAYNQVVFNSSSTTVTVPYGGSGQSPTRPNIKPGGWILDGTMFDASGNPNPQGYFYRVVDVIDNSGSLTLELQNAPRLTTAVGGQGMLIVLDNVAEVFEKRSISLQ
jgi:prepilin-type N-terminal cleavage/methylation domain-containing protein